MKIFFSFTIAENIKKATIYGTFSLVEVGKTQFLKWIFSQTRHHTVVSHNVVTKREPFLVMLF